MGRNPDSVDHSSFSDKDEGGRKGRKSRGLNILGVVRSSELQRVMKQRHRSATYFPISLLNERMSRNQVKNELAQHSPLREKNGIPFPSKTAHIPTYYPTPPLSSKVWFQWGMID